MGELYKVCYNLCIGVMSMYDICLQLDGTLPFTPFVGLKIDIWLKGDWSLTCEEIVWDDIIQTFKIELVKDVSYIRPYEAVIAHAQEHYVPNGWKIIQDTRVRDQQGWLSFPEKHPERMAVLETLVSELQEERNHPCSPKRRFIPETK